MSKTYNIPSLKPYGPRPADAPEDNCQACGELFREGDYTELVALGPGKDPESRAAYLAGRPYNAVCAHVHWACAYGKEWVE